MDIPASRREARELGAARYNTGKPCKNGHRSDRDTKRGECLDCLSERQKAYRDKNRDKVASWNAVYHADNRSRLLAEKRAYRQQNRAAISERMQRYRQENKATVRASVARRRARKRDALPSWFGEFDEFAISEAHELAAARSTASGFAWEVDHLLPLGGREVAGLHVGINIQVIPAYLNRWKSNRLVLTEPGEWASHI